MSSKTKTMTHPVLGLFSAVALLAAAGAATQAQAEGPDPVLMVVADQQDFYYQDYGDTRMDPMEDVDALMGVVGVEPPPPAQKQPMVTGVTPAPEPANAAKLASRPADPTYLHLTLKNAQITPHNVKGVDIKAASATQTSSSVARDT